MYSPLPPPNKTSLPPPPMLTSPFPFSCAPLSSPPPPTTDDTMETLAHLTALVSLHITPHEWSFSLQQLQPLSACTRLTELGLAQLALGLANDPRRIDRNGTQVGPVAVSSRVLGFEVLNQQTPAIGRNGTQVRAVSQPSGCLGFQVCPGFRVSGLTSQLNGMSARLPLRVLPQMTDPHSCRGKRRQSCKQQQQQRRRCTSSSRVRLCLLDPALCGGELLVPAAVSAQSRCRASRIIQWLAQQQQEQQHVDRAPRKQRQQRLTPGVGLQTAAAAALAAAAPRLSL